MRASRSCSSSSRFVRRACATSRCSSAMVPRLLRRRARSSNGDRYARLPWLRLCGGVVPGAAEPWCLALLALSVECHVSCCAPLLPDPQALPVGTVSGVSNGASRGELVCTPFDAPCRDASGVDGAAVVSKHDVQAQVSAPVQAPSSDTRLCRRAMRAPDVWPSPPRCLRARGLVAPKLLRRRRRVPEPELRPLQCGDWNRTPALGDTSSPESRLRRRRPSRAADDAAGVNGEPLAPEEGDNTWEARCRPLTSTPRMPAGLTMPPYAVDERRRRCWLPDAAPGLVASGPIDEPANEQLNCDSSTDTRFCSFRFSSSMACA